MNSGFYTKVTKLDYLRQDMGKNNFFCQFCLMREFSSLTSQPITELWVQDFTVAKWLLFFLQQHV
jgi:hypothetical protein